MSAPIGIGWLVLCVLAIYFIKLASESYEDRAEDFSDEDREFEDH